MTFDNTDTQSTTSAAASFIETLGRKASIVSPRTDDNESTFLTPSTLEGNNHNSRSQRANSIVAGASPFVSSSSLWTASTSYDSLTYNSVEPNASASGSLWETPRRSSVSALPNWKCVGSAASMLHDNSGKLSDLISEDSLEIKSRPRVSSIVIEKPSFAASVSGKISDEEPQKPTLSLSNSQSRPTSPLDIARGHFMQLPALLHEEIGIESAEEAAEIFKRSSMDSLLDFDPATLFSSLNPKVPTPVDLKGSTLMSAMPSNSVNTVNNPSDFRRHSFNWLSNDGNGYDSFGPSNFSVKPIAEVSLPSSGTNSPAISSPRGSPLDTFPEEFIFAPSSSVAQLSKKRFARRHSIAADGVAALEDSFAQTLSFGNPADAAEFIPSGHFHHSNSYYNSSAEEFAPITGNIYAAYAGLLGEDFVPESTGSSAAGELNTFLNSMRSNSGHCGGIMFNHQIPVSYTPAQAGINPTALSFPNATFHLPSHKGPLYLIEFKSGRTELFFVVDLDTALKVKVDDLVIVEADRGEDFGRITGEIPIAKVRQLISQLPHDHQSSHHSSSAHSHHSADDSYGSNGNVNHNLAGLKESEIAALLAAKEIVPKRIHRHATALDMKFLQAKAQEEAYAMSRCQSRIRQKKLPMEVVDAEYQW